MYNICVGNSEGKRPLRETRYKLKHNNKMDIKETREGVEGINVSQDCDQWVL
jgi:hypothetical protein